ncbi:MAG: Zn-dependent hydrolase, partial [Geminicoccales bacterium]
MTDEGIAGAVERQLPMAERFFSDLARRTQDGEGVTRAAWSPEDQAGIDMLAQAGRGLGLEVAHDPAGNVYLTLPGRNRNLPAVLMGSHLDSVPKGGNYDGAAGAVAGLVVLATLKERGVTPTCDMRCVGLRGEESVWYGIAYIGSRLAVGALDPAMADRLVRGDTGRTLAEHMRAVGVNPAVLRAAEPYISPANTRAFLELHIEQGPLLVERNLPAAIPTVIRGNVRFPYARCLGAYAHSAAVPRGQRRDALLATVELVGRLDALWQALEAEGHADTVFTVGKLYTDPGEHAMTKVPGACRFTLNFGGTSKNVLDKFRDRTRALGVEIAEKRNVAFELGECVGSDPTPLEPALRARLSDAASALGIPTIEMPTVGHDASIFARAGIPSAMVLVRNRHGSHNAAEAMDIADFGEGVKLLAAAALGVAE